MATTDLSAYRPLNIANTDKMIIGIVVSEWNEFATFGMRDGAVDTLLKEGVQKENIVVHHVPGAYELSYGAMKMAKKNYDAVIAIGCVIRGETAHFDYVCSAVAQGIKDVNILTDTPAIFCVLTDDNREQSIARSGGIHGNKGIEAAVTALKMAALRKML